MNYCSLNDAWGSNDFISSQFKEYMNVNNSQPQQQTETFVNISKKPEHIKYEEFTDIELSDCDKVITHVRKCRKCFKRLRSLIKPNVFEGIIDENREVIIMILIGISIMSFFNLVNNITK